MEESRGHAAAPGELARWARWHALRMAICCAALAAALLALYAPPRG